MHTIWFKDIVDNGDWFTKVTAFRMKFKPRLSNKEKGMHFPVNGCYLFGKIVSPGWSNCLG